MNDEFKHGILNKKEIFSTDKETFFNKRKHRGNLVKITKILKLACNKVNKKIQENSEDPIKTKRIK